MKNVKQYVIETLENFPSDLKFYDQASKVKVDRTSLRRVAQAIKDGDITVRNGKKSEMGAAGGKYRAKNNANLMLFPTAMKATVRAQSIIVHESVHALHDIEEVTLSRPLNELSTYVAQYWYQLIRAGKKFKDPKPGSIGAAAVKVAIELMAQTAKADLKSLLLSTPGVGNLISVISSNDLYADKVGTEFEGDGV